MKKRSALLSTVALTFVFLALLGISLTAQAAPLENVPSQPQALLLAENFDYGAVPMSLTVASGGNWANHSGVSPYVGYTTTSLSMAGYGSSGVGGAATIATNGSEDVNRSFAPQSSGIVYFSALVNVSAAGSGTYFMHLKDATISGFRARVFAKLDVNVLRFGLDTSSSTGVYATGVYTYNTTYLLVTKHNLDTGATALYVLDSFTPTEPVSPSVSFTTGTTLTISSIAFRQASGGPSAVIDGVRVANTWQEVVGAAPTAEADLSILKTGPATANSSENITYTINLSNTGTATAATTVVTDILPPEVSFVTYTTASAVTFTQASATELVWELGDVLTSTPEINIQVVGVITSNIINGTVVTNTAVAASASSESNVNNNISPFTTTVSSPVVPDVEVYVEKTGPAVVFGGELVNYTIVYGNAGTQTVEATLTDTLPINFTTSDIAVDTSALNPIDDTGTRAWTATLASGDRFTFTLALTVPTAIVNNTLITNTIEITATGSGNNPSNDLSAASSAVYQIVPISNARAGTNGEVFGVEGQVIYAPNTFGTAEWGVQDASGGIAVFYSPALTTSLYDRVRLVATRGVFNTQAQLASPVYYFDNLGAGPVVEPMPYTTGQVAAGASEGWLVVVTGTVSSLTGCSTTLNYQFDLNDGSGSTVIFVDKDTLVDVCTQGVVNGDRIVVTGFSTQFSSIPEVKPRFPADVKRLFDVTFVYHDLEDVVHPGEDVQLRGDFTNWGTNPITMTADAGYTVFSATVTLPTTATQAYKYYVDAVGGNTAWNLLNTNNRALSITQGTTIQNDYRTVTIGWGNMNGPAAQTINLGSPTASIDGQLYVQEVTDPAGPGRGLMAEVGYGNAIDPSTWSWSSMAFASQTGNNDVYAGVITPTAGGVYSYATRYNGNWGAGNPNSMWVYADLNGIPFSLDQTGVLTVTAPQLAIAKAVETANSEVDLGEVVTYTLTLSNTGDGTAAGIMITDVLPSAISFGGFVQQNGAAYGSGTITWNGSLNASASNTIIFTATVNNDRFLHGTDVLNTAQFTSGNGGSGSDSIAFAVVKRYFLYLPLIQR